MQIGSNETSYKISDDSFCLSGHMSISLSGVDSQALIFDHASASDFDYAGEHGELVTERASTGSVEVTRELFSSATTAGIRLKIRNVTDEELTLSSVTPMLPEGRPGLEFNSHGLDTCRVLKTGRFKADIPGCFRPSVVDVDYRDAAFNAQKITAGAGTQGDVSSNYNLNRIVCEPMTFIKSGADESSRGLAVCVIGQEHHLTSIYISPPGDGTPGQFGIMCEFDGVLMEPGAERHTHWIVFYRSENEAYALDRFVEIQQKELDLRPLAPPQNLFCSWYFYGREFLPEDLSENIASLKERPVPVDVFIIDNGWIDAFGDWNANEKWPAGMAEAADLIKSAGLTPGIWTAPFVLMKHSKTAKEHPELIARNRDGSLATFGYVEGECYVIDPTVPYCREYFREMFSRLKSWGFTYHKLDFVRALAVNEHIAFADPKVNRAQAYSLGLKLIREALGEDGYILACGGIYDAANYRYADSIRTGSDSIGTWQHPSRNRAAGTLVQIKQGLVRNYTSRLIRTDPDSLMLRRRTEPFRIHEVEKHNWLSDGQFTDEEAFSLVVKQYLTGGNTNITERLTELPEDRRALLRHIIPAFAPPARILDYEKADCPTLALTYIEPAWKSPPSPDPAGSSIPATSQYARGGGPSHANVRDGARRSSAGFQGATVNSTDSWRTLAISNWDDTPVTRSISLVLPGLVAGEEYAVFEFRGQRFVGILAVDDEMTVELPVHATRVFRIAPWKNEPLLLGTDMHLSGGGCELADVIIGDDSIRGRLDTKWDYPAKIHALFPSESGPIQRQVTVAPGNEFSVSYEE